MDKNILMFLCSWLFVGMASTTAAFGGLYSPNAPLLLLIPSYFLFLLLKKCFTNIKKLNTYECMYLLSLAAISALHLTGIFAPETGFDAVWYHLPVIKHIALQQKIVYIPDLYQSVNPLFSDLIYGLGFLAFKETGVKMVAYLFYISTLVVTYTLSRLILKREWALLMLISISTYQVIAWQSTSFYVDLPKAFWELASLYILLNIIDQKITSKTQVLLSGLLFGASLATKLFSLILLPLMVLLAKIVTKNYTSTLLFLVATLILPIPFYNHALVYTGNPFYSFTAHIDKLAEIGNQNSILLYLLSRVLSFHTSLFELLIARDYTSITLIIFLPLTVRAIYRHKSNKKIMILSLFTSMQYILWWCIPPLSTRYALSGFITWGVLTLWSLYTLTQKKPTLKYSFVYSIVLATLFHSLPRIMVLQRTMNYLLQRQTKQSYIEQFYDGNVDQHLQSWHKLE